MGDDGYHQGKQSAHGEERLKDEDVPDGKASEKGRQGNRD
jgi:hypothetical protein